MLQSVDAALNLIWVLVSAGTLLAWRLRGTREPRQAAAILFILVLVMLFPVISTADDPAQQGLACDVALSPLSDLSVNEVKSGLAAAVAAPAAPGPALPLLRRTRERVLIQEFTADSRLFVAARGNHSPPRL